MKQNFLIELLKKAQGRSFVSYEAKVEVIGNYDETTQRRFGTVVNIYNHLRRQIFHNALSPVVLTLTRNAPSMGYYSPQPWRVNERNYVPQINISPAILQLPVIEVMSFLVHQMCHHFQHLYGQPPHNESHDIQFYKIMLAIGLMCSSTGKPGGKVIGRRMNNYVIEGGLFKAKIKAMPKEYLLPFTPPSIEFKDKRINLMNIKANKPKKRQSHTDAQSTVCLTSSRFLN